MASNTSSAGSRARTPSELASSRRRESPLDSLLFLLRSGEPLAVTTIDLRSNEIHWSDRMYDLFGVDRATFSPTFESVRMLLGPAEWRQFCARLDAARAGTLSPSEFQYRITHPDGSTHVLTARALLLRDGDHVPSFMVGTFADDTRRASTERELAKRVSQQEAIATLGVSALRDPDLDALCAQATQLVSETSTAEYVGVFELVGQRLHYRTGVGFDRDRVEGVSIPADRTTPAGHALQLGRPVLLTDARCESRFSVPAEVFADEIRSGISVPIQAQGGNFGTLCAFSPRAGAFSEDDVHFHQAVANVIAAAIEVDRRRAQLSSQSRRLLSAQEDERARMARELHDELGQQLTAMWLSLKAAARANGDGARPRIDQALSMLDATIDQVRELARSLRPSHLDDLGLEAALRAMVARLQEHVGIPLHLRLDGVPATLAPQIATACFRIVQEALTNAVRHARASAVWIEVAGRADHLGIEIRDDGVGFDTERARRAGPLESGLGLLSLEERADLVGGLLTIESGEQGTIVRARLPLVPTAPP